MDREANISVTKAEFRVRMIARRRSIPEKSRMDSSAAIADHLVSLPEVILAHHIHLYLSMTRQAEVCTEFLVERLTAMAKKISVPVIRDGLLYSALFHQGDAVVQAPFGQPEPAELTLADESHLDVVLLPLLAFDDQGYRLGYGKGHYDRFLRRLSEQKVNPFRIGLSFFTQKVETVPVDIWDEPLDAVVHEHGIIRYFSSDF
ncbi:MAG: 5-formyltetrahydrofolate cyclo-ligase [Chlorobium sp.]|nr:MAG: 5-formyltetrahydrofolate cyclo-ligase [Chlorobium sp.]